MASATARGASKAANVIVVYQTVNPARTFFPNTIFRAWWMRMLTSHFGLRVVLEILLFTGADEKPGKCCARPVNFSSENLQDAAAEPRVLSHQLVHQFWHPAIFDLCDTRAATTRRGVRIS